MAEQITFRDTYLVNMDKLSRQPLGYNMCTLPITRKNGKRIRSKAVRQMLFSEDHVALMKERYYYLAKILGPIEARKIYEYKDTNGKVIVRLYPTGRIEIVSNDWTHVDNAVIKADIEKITAEHNKFINAASDSQRKK